MIKTWKDDLPASLVVFLVALPLCLGIAFASEAPPMAGIIAGVVGGIIVGAISGSQISVSGPAAGLTLIVSDAIKNLGTFEAFLLAVLISGVFQIIIGFLRLGIIGTLFPNSVIKGMLAAIGLILILKQIPHALGYTQNFAGDEDFDQADGRNTFTTLVNAFENPFLGAVILSVVAIIILLIWETKKVKNSALAKIVPGALVAVVSGILIQKFIFPWLHLYFEGFVLEDKHLVQLPVLEGVRDINQIFVMPDFSRINEISIWKIAGKIALIASIETLLSLEASDKLDPKKRISPPNLELKAQGIGNVFSGLIGGLPITAVIVRSSANVVAGAKSKWSAVFHGVLLLICVLLIPGILNMIPYASLSAVLLLVGYKLVSTKVIKEVILAGKRVYIPFFITLIAILLTDLLSGIAIGLAVGFFFVMTNNFKKGIQLTVDRKYYYLRLGPHVSYMNKGFLRETFQNIPQGASVLIDGTQTLHIDSDSWETIADFVESAESRGIEVELKKSHTSVNSYFKIDN